MARWENEDVSDLNLPEPINITRVYLDKNGKEIEDPQLAFAKISKSDDKNIYYIKYGRGEIVDPHHIDANFKKNDSYYVFKKVTERAFASYEKFLKTKNRLHFTTARRLVMERI